MSPPSAFGPYRVLHQIGSGVLGPVFRSYDTHGERLLAIKALKLDLVPENAIQVAAMLRATMDRVAAVPGLATIVDCGTERGTPFLALEYVSGDALDVHLRQAPTLSLADTRRLLSAMAEAVDAAWEQDISHGALHPRDVFLGTEAGQVKITGFAIAQALEAVGAKAPVRHPYSAPERISGGEWDRRADIYSLGAIAREVLGRRTDVPESWQRAVSRAMAESPAERYDTAQSFVDELVPVPAATRPAAAPRTVTVPAPVVTTAPPMKVEAVPSFDRMREAPPPSAAPMVDVPMFAGVSARPRETERMSGVALAAVGVAGIAIGLVGGYYWGSRNADRPAAPQVAAVNVPEAKPTPVEPDPALPAATPTPEVTPPAPTPAATPAPSPRPAKPAPVATRGSLLVDTRPSGAAVLVDGRAAPKPTPVVIEELSPGTHSVLIQLKGHRSVPSKVVIVAGEQTRLALSLERLSVLLESLPRKLR